MCKNQYSFVPGENKSSPRITINHIFSHNHNWDVYRFNNVVTLRSVEIHEVEKMLTCGDCGFRLYMCPHCNEIKAVHFGCNSRVCTHCGKKFADKWSKQIARQTFDVKHRHVVLTIPDQLRPIFEDDRSLLKVLMDCSINVISYVCSQT